MPLSGRAGGLSSACDIDAQVRAMWFGFGPFLLLTLLALVKNIWFHFIPRER